MTTATFVKKLDYNGDARLYHLSEPVRVGWPPFDDDEPDDRPETRWIVVSAVVSSSGPETLIFGADKEGKFLSWSEIGGFRGGLDHSQAIRYAGWEEV